MAERAAIYSRISKDDQRDELGVIRQEKRCREFVAAQGWDVAEVYRDNDRSASTEHTNRPRFNALISDVKAGKVDRLVVLKQDRLVRKPDELESVMRTLRTAGVDVIHTVSDGPVNVSTTTGRTMARVKGVFDIAYSEFISEKVRDKKDELAAAGKPAGGGTRPFGFEKDGVTVRQTEADALADAAHRILAGESLGSIARDWNEHGPATVSGTKWAPNVIRNAVISPRAAGLRQHRGEIVGKAAWPAIIDRDTWEAVRGVVQAPSRAHRPREGRHLLTRILVCGLCGAGLVTGSNNGDRAYTCRKSHGGCNRISVPAAPVEEIITEAVLYRLEGDGLSDALAASRTGDGAAALAEIEARLAELAEVYAAGEITMGEWLTARRSLEAQLAEARRGVTDTAEARVIEPLLRAGALRKQWPDLAANTRRAVVEFLISEIVVAPAGPRGRWAPVGDRLTATWKV